MDDYDYDYSDYGYGDEYSSDWDYGGDMPGDGSGVMYGSDVEPSMYSEPTYGGDMGADTPIDWSQYAPSNGYDSTAGMYGSDFENPDMRAAFNAQPDMMDSISKIPGAAGSAFTKKLGSDPMGTLAKMAGFGSSIYSTLQKNKQREALAKQMKDAKAAREAKLAQYGAVMPMKMNREQLTPQGSLLTAGMRPGGVNWFGPTTFTHMADGGAVPPGWLARIQAALSSRQADPSLVGTGAAAGAGNAMLQQQYQRYAVGQEMEGGKALPFEVWAQMRQQGKGYADGGAVPTRGWLDKFSEALSARRPSPAVMGSGAAAGAGNAILAQQYQRYAVGQEMEGGKALPFEAWAQMRQQGKGMARGGLSSLIQGEGGGQDDVVDVKAAPGEYIFSAQDVSDIGDGDNTAGAAKLDAMRAKLRVHKKRSKDLAPKAKLPEAYLKGGK